MGRSEIEEENRALRAQNAQLLSTLRDIRHNSVDREAVVHASAHGEVDSLLARDAADQPEVNSLPRAAALQESDEQNRLMIEGVRDWAIYMIDPEGCIINWNDGAARLYGYVADEIIGQSWRRFFTPTDVAKGLPDHGLVAAAKRKFSEESWCVRKDGSRFWAEATISPLHDAAGRLRGFVHVAHDLTERRRSEALLIAITDSVGAGIIGTTEGGHIQSFNLGAQKQFGYVAAEVVGQSASMLVPESHRAEYEGYLAAVLPVGELKTSGIDRRLIGRRKDGSTFPIEVQLTEFALEGVRYFSAVVTDITLLRGAEEAVRTNALRLQMALDAGKMGAWAWDIRANKSFWTDREFELLDIPPTGAAVDTNVFFERVHPDDRPGLELALADVFASGTEFRGEFRVVRPNGEHRWLAGVGRLFRDIETGAASEMYGVNFEITERKQIEAALHLRDRALLAVRQGLLITDPNQADNPIVYVSPGFERMTGYRAEETLGRNCRFLQGSGTDRATVSVLREAIRAEKECAVELLNYRRDGTPFWNALVVSPVRDELGQLVHFVGVQADVTERRDLEEQVRQSQKMEAFGQLASGVAHDFNNLLTIISGHSDILLTEMSECDPHRASVVEISEAGERAAGLTRQLLAFSRKSVLEPRLLDLNEVVRGAERMLRRMIGEDVLLATMLERRIGRVKIDAGQMTQVLMNLAVNARDAMPQGGKLTIATSRVELDQEYVSTHVEARAGSHVLLAVSDSGVGMSREVQARIFEPFFTTKDVDKGTGLGLSVVHGIVKQSSGHIEVYSEPSVGTTFKIYIPVVAGLAFSDAQPATRPVGGNETVLLVEDDDSVRNVALRVLRKQGYAVLSAASGQAALEMVEHHTGGIDILVTDVVMPAMSGRQLAVALRPRLPRMKVLFVSGYTSDAVLRHGILDAEVAFLQKPYTPSALLLKLRQVLDDEMAQAPG